MKKKFKTLINQLEHFKAILQMHHVPLWSEDV